MKACLEEDGFEAGSGPRLSGLDLADFFNATVRGTGELPLETLLRSTSAVEHAFARWQSNRTRSSGGYGVARRTSCANAAVSMGADIGVKSENGMLVFTVRARMAAPAERSPAWRPETVCGRAGWHRANGGQNCRPSASARLSRQRPQGIGRVSRRRPCWPSNVRFRESPAEYLLPRDRRRRADLNIETQTSQPGWPARQ